MNIAVLYFPCWILVITNIIDFKTIVLKSMLISMIYNHSDSHNKLSTITYTNFFKTNFGIVQFVKVYFHGNTPSKLYKKWIVHLSFNIDIIKIWINFLIKFVQPFKIWISMKNFQHMVYFL